jgi:hypothetical protein
MVFPEENMGAPVYKASTTSQDPAEGILHAVSLAARDAERR